MVKREEEIFLNIKVVDEETKTDISDQYDGIGEYSIQLVDFEPITIYVDGKEVNITSENAVKVNIGNMYILENCIYNAKDGESIDSENNDVGLLVRDSSYDSLFESAIRP